LQPTDLLVARAALEVTGRAMLETNAGSQLLQAIADRGCMEAVGWFAVAVDLKIPKMTKKPSGACWEVAGLALQSTFTAIG